RHLTNPYSCDSCCAGRRSGEGGQVGMSAVEIAFLLGGDFHRQRTSLWLMSNGNAESHGANEIQNTVRAYLIAGDHIQVLHVGFLDTELDQLYRDIPMDIGECSRSRYPLCIGPHRHSACGLE